MISDAGELQDFLKQYEGWVIDVLTPARKQLHKILSEFRKQDYWKDYDGSDGRQPLPTPIHRTYSRIKRPESAVDKILRKPDSFPDGLSIESIQKMPDSLGARITTFFLSGLPLVHNELTNHPQIEIYEDDPPVAYLDDELLQRLGLGELQGERKKSGYASIHYLVKLKPEAIDGKESPLIEIQVRTLTWEIWGEIEHVLGYKPNKRTSFAVQKQFKILANQLMATDEHFNFLFEEQSRYREEKDIDDTDPLNAENLPAILDKCGLNCAQREIDGLLRMLASRGIGSVKEFLESANLEKIELIKNTYRAKEGRAPVDFEVIANIAATAKTKDTEVTKGIVESQIEFLNTWELLKRQSTYREEKDIGDTKKLPTT